MDDLHEEIGEMDDGLFFTVDDLLEHVKDMGKGHLFTAYDLYSSYFSNPCHSKHVTPCICPIHVRQKIGTPHNEQGNMF